MPNHVHLLVTPQRPGAVASMMQDLGRRYVRIFNDAHSRTGTLREGRYRAAVIDCETYFLTCQRYIELNPVRASIVNQPADYKWSSHRHYAVGVDNPLITPHAIFRNLAVDDVQRRHAYIALFEETITPPVLDQIRQVTNQGWALGSEGFLQRVERATGRTVRPPKRGRPNKNQTGSNDGGEMLI